MISDLYRNDKEIWHMALWFLLALELASEVIEFHVKVFVGLNSAWGWPNAEHTLLSSCSWSRRWGHEDEGLCVALSWSGAQSSPHSAAWAEEQLEQGTLVFLSDPLERLAEM